MTAEDLEAEFEARGTRRGGTLLLQAPAALALVQCARQARVPILGIDSFHLGPTSTEPDLNYILDLSGASCRTNPWAEAEAFLDGLTGSGMHFEVVLGAPRAAG